MNKPKNIRNKEIENFLEEVASKKPTPGGGAVAAVVGAMAASLVVMVCNLTKGADSLQLIADGANKNKKKFLGLADEDCAAFEAVMAAYKSKSKIKIKKALLRAIEVPEKTKKLAKEIEKLAIIVAKKGNKNAYSDAMSAVYLAQAAVKSAEENIKINQIALVRLK